MPSPLSGVSLYKEMGKLRNYANSVRIFTNEADKLFFRWNAEERGGLLTKRLATDFAEYAKVALLNQVYKRELQPLSPDWVKWKERVGGGLEGSDIGLGVTMKLVNAIQPIRTAQGGFKVGIKVNETADTTVTDQRTGKKVRYGSTNKLWKIFEWLETGTTTPQPPRPWFLLAFLDWQEEKFPEFIKKSLIRDLIRAAHKLPHELGYDFIIEMKTTKWADKFTAASEEYYRNIY